MLSERFTKENNHLLKNALSNGAYEVLKSSINLKSEEIIKTVIDSGLRGRGGAGFPTGKKWSFLPKNTELPTYLVINGDEGEPGTFKDRDIMRYDPHLLLEGIALASLAIEAEYAYIYIRGEFHRECEIIEKAITEAENENLIGKNFLKSGKNINIIVHRGAGAYICGEETGLLSSIEGKPGKPKLKPPFPAVKGLFNCPTIINNVETISFIPSIIKNGAEWFKKTGRENNSGTRLYCISGNVNLPGVYELPMGKKIRSLIFDYAGGIENDKRLKAIIPGGCSAPVLLPDEIDIPHDFDSLAAKGSLAGSGGIIVIDEDQDMVEIASIISSFYAHESCGQCSQCREGTRWLKEAILKFKNNTAELKDLETLRDITDNMTQQTICALSDAAAMSISAILRKFPQEFESRCK